MTSLLSRLNGTKTSVPIEPRDIFMSLPQKDKRYEYPRDVQSDVWKHWFQSRNKKNCVIAVVTFLKRKNGLIQRAEQVVFAYVTDVLDMFPLHDLESRTINCMQLSSFYAKRKSPSDQV